MKEYKLQGVSCANCAQEMEEEIKKLSHGENTELHFSSSKLRVEDGVDLNQVRRILKTDGASLIEDEGNSHRHGSNLRLFVILSSLIFGATFLLQGIAASFLLISMYVAAIVISGHQTFWKGLKNLVRLKFNIDTLMTIALIGAVSIGEWKEATLVAILFGLNEYLEGLGMEKARNSMEQLLKVAPKQATKIMEDGTEKVVAIEDLQEGDIVLVKAGEKIPSDGTVASGHSSVNEAAITGESLPVDKRPGEKLFGGSINNEGLLRVEITKAYGESSLAKILQLVEEAQERKTPTELFINRFAKYYTPLIMVIAGLVIVAPPLLFAASWAESFYQGLAVLIVGCPCALILSSPIAILSGITKNARNGILIKGGAFLEQLGKIESMAFDKTGTLTKGEPKVHAVQVYEEEKFFSVARAIERHSSHPIAAAILDYSLVQEADVLEPSSVDTIPGKGIRAEIEGQTYYVGSEQTLDHLDLAQELQGDIDRMKEVGYTLVLVSDEKAVLGMFGVADEVREESRTLMQRLHSLGIKHTIMLTGDHEKTAEKVAGEIGVSDVHAQLLPDQKVEKIEELKKKGRLAMIGDGINDAPALTMADLGIAMGKGTDSAIETADIVLMQDHLGKLPHAFRIAKRVNAIVKWNISIALGLKVFALLLTIPGWLTLWFAILADMGATILVTLISLTVLLMKE
ncbi:Cd2+/Zn2+-exporting ATPase [Halobacillus karajensis]|uniref:Cd(2+)-exporting ATPase n=1 Tax=Halobacillus karajensis TaxID=195088 RepID=A0A024PAB4_9BACI|nr:heavy metal translocating P-type ATPase [Halobacillus karajensis]CDQ21432.1 putative cadmium-transporting ATPase [Halobacillus karajensis]CDQ25367.1 putative cadmium-transporting ATPase [Halobacillus karajensis]CDQ29691.1 putative cadmium-transporting ATPase [Halobacillus karajensis]SEI07547.1 Cd2+/Zn2+-exporting ATPase [Halobacillus karajensis]